MFVCDSVNVRMSVSESWTKGESRHKCQEERSTQPREFTNYQCSTQAQPCPLLQKILNKSFWKFQINDRNYRIFLTTF